MASNKHQRQSKKTVTPARRTAGASEKRGGKPKAEGNEQRHSALNGAATVLGESGESLNCAEMVKAMLGRGLWTTNGKTPAATLYAAILREITKKGKQSRFRKSERGKFKLVA